MEIGTEEKVQPVLGKHEDVEFKSPAPVEKSGGFRRPFRALPYSVPVSDPGSPPVTTKTLPSEHQTA